MEEQIGDRISKERKKIKMTQSELADKLMVSNKAISKWESNGGNPSIEFLPKLADLFGCTIDYLVRGYKKQTAENNTKFEVCLGANEQGKDEFFNFFNIAHLLIDGYYHNISNKYPLKIIDQLLKHSEKAELKMAFIGTDFMFYRHIPQLFAPIALNKHVASHVINLCKDELERRYELLRNKNISSFEDYKKIENLPYIVLCISEFFDFSSGTDYLAKDIQYISQLGRGVGIYLLIANDSFNRLPKNISANMINTISFEPSRDALNCKIALINNQDDNGEDKRFTNIDYKMEESLKTILYLREIDYSEDLDCEALQLLLAKDDRKYLLEDIDELVKMNYFTISTIQHYFHLGYAKASNLFELFIDGNLIEKSLKEEYYTIKANCQDKIKKLIINFLATNI